MIVKNESRVIERCLNSVKHLIDYWVIVDTGSTDETQELIKECLKGIPGELIERPWKNFGYNRTEALKLAETKADYLLFMDADDWLEFSPGFELNLSADCYLIRWYLTKNFSYYKPQIIKADLGWEWIGVIHEYLHCNKVISKAQLAKVRYMYGADGHRSQDPEKHLKVVAILEEALKADPNNSRYQFYLAQNLCNCGKFNEAIDAYKRRIGMVEGCREEVFNSFLILGLLKHLLQYPIDEVIESYNQANNLAPSRSEPIYFLADIYNQKGSYAQTYKIIKDWLQTPQVTAEEALQFDWTRKYGLDLQFSLCAYYLGYTQEFLDTCDRLLANEELPEAWKTLIERNRACVPR